MHLTMVNKARASHILEKETSRTKSSQTSFVVSSLPINVIPLGWMFLEIQPRRICTLNYCTYKDVKHISFVELQQSLNDYLYVGCRLLKAG